VPGRLFVSNETWEKKGVRVVNKLHLLMLLGFFVSLSVPGGIQAENEDPIIAEVGDIHIRQSELDRKIQEVPPVARRNFETKEGQITLLERMIRSKAMMKAAEEAGYLDRTDIQLQLEDQRERILAYEYFQEHISPGPMPSESDLLAFYEEHKDDMFKVDATAEARQIVLENKDTAVNVKEMIEQGAITFENAVESYSIDETRENRGYLGVLTHNSFIRGIGRSKPFIDMVFNLKSGEISDPFETRKGWHLVELIRLRNEGYQSFETVKQEIARKILVTPNDIQKEYNSNPEKYAARERCKISHILLKTREEAENVLAEFRQGKDFSYLVRQYSTDLQTAKQDGNLGYLYKGGYIRGIGQDVEFENAVFALNEGDVSHPIESRKGWHIVRIDEKEKSEIKPLIEVQENIRQELTEKKLEQYQEEKFDALGKRFDVKIYAERLQDK
jgi:parvulin-like peptidyl-prolyl isomerase